MTHQSINTSILRTHQRRRNRHGKPINAHIHTRPEMHSFFTRKEREREKGIPIINVLLLDLMKKEEGLFYCHSGKWPTVWVMSCNGGTFIIFNHCNPSRRDPSEWQQRPNDSFFFLLFISKRGGGAKIRLRLGCVICLRAWPLACTKWSSCVCVKDGGGVGVGERSRIFRIMVRERSYFNIRSIAKLCSVMLHFLLFGSKHELPYILRTSIQLITRILPKRVKPEVYWARI